MSPAYIWQVLLNDAGGRRSRRSDITEQALVVARPLLDLIAGQQVENLGHVQVEHYGGGIVVRVSDSEGVRAAIGIVTRSRDSRVVWRTLHIETIADLATEPAVPPAAPWCGLVLADRMRACPQEETLQLVVLARVLGWAWMERGI